MTGNVVDGDGLGSLLLCWIWCIFVEWKIMVFLDAEMAIYGVYLDPLPNEGDDDALWCL